MEISLQKLFTQKGKTIFHSGGPGSGFKDHSGRPGFVGGSRRDNYIGDIPYYTPVKPVYRADDAKDLFGKPDRTIIVGISGKYRGEIYYCDSKVNHSEIVRVMNDRFENPYDTERRETVDNFARFRVLKKGKAEISAFMAGVEWQNPFDEVSALDNIYEVMDVMRRKGLPQSNNIVVTDLRKGNLIVNRQLFLSGGPGSGFRGHHGRPGAVGGSSSHRLGAAYKRTLYRGVSNTPSDSGDLGIGTYYTTSKSMARQYGKIISEEVALENPVYLTGEQAIELAKQFHTMELQAGNENSRKLTQYLISQGYDGIVADGYDSPPGHQTVVVFPKNLFAQGGAGSGFHGHKGRPGAVGGSLKEGEGQSLEEWFKEHDTEEQKSVKERIRKKYDERLEEKSRHRKRVEDTVRKLGFPVERVDSTEDEGYIFELNGQKFRAGGQYDPVTGRISIYNIDEVTDDNMQGMLAHEIQHSRFHEFRTEVQKQFVEVNRAVKNRVQKNWPIESLGGPVKDKYKEKYWAYDIDQMFLTTGSENWKKLRTTDGVSKYSQSYWNKYESTGSPWDFNSAVDETLAEIARLDIGSSRTGDVSLGSIDPVWQGLYQRVKRGAGTVKNQLLFLFGGEGSGYHGHLGRPGVVGGSSKKGSIQRTKGIVNMYHGTSDKFIDEIIWDGLKKQSNPSKSVIGGGVRPASVYMAEDYDQARAYGEAFATGSYGVVEITVPRGHQEEVFQDEYDLENFGIENNYRIERDIPPAWISKITLYENDEEERVIYMKDGQVSRIVKNLFSQQSKYYAPFVFNKPKKKR